MEKTGLRNSIMSKRLTLNIKSEDLKYLKLLEEEARQERRTLSQQAAYILQHYFAQKTSGKGLTT